MNFTLNEDQELLASSVDAFLKTESPVDRVRTARDDVRGWSPDLWRQMGELGLLAVPFPEALGGLDGSFVELSVLLERFGKALLLEPFTPSIPVCGYLLGTLGTEAQQERWLKPVLEGAHTLALAWAERHRRDHLVPSATVAEREGDGWRLTGHKVWVENGHAADHLLVSARVEDGVALFVVEPGEARITPVEAIDGHTVAQVELDGVLLSADRQLGGAGEAGRHLERAVLRGAAAAAAEGVGVAQVLLDMAVDYLKTRTQFDVKIGSFQALQHLAVDMLVETELLRSVAIASTVNVDGADLAEARRSVHSAKVQLTRSGRLVAQSAIQIFGGIGCTDEHDVGLYFKRLHGLTWQWGDADTHLVGFSTVPGFL